MPFCLSTNTTARPNKLFKQFTDLKKALHGQEKDIMDFLLLTESWILWRSLTVTPGKRKLNLDLYEIPLVDL